MVQEVHEGDLQVVGAAAGRQSGEKELPPPAPAPAPARLEFCCKYCDRKFDNKHALGGHQNGHRVERAMDPEIIAKRIRRGGFMDYAFLHSHFPGFSSFSGDLVNLSRQYFMPRHPIPSPEIPTGLPYGSPFPPAVPAETRPSLPVENHSPLAQVSPPVAAMAVSCHPISSPEIPTSQPNAYPFPPSVPVENHSPLAQFLPPAMTVSGENTLPGVSGGSSVTPLPGSSIVSNSNPGNAPEINNDGELDLTLKL